ncbi:PREDICTED: cell surface glycoprotein MUC18-like [Cyprinodon variegatus]|uniref:cell surface glycoprotein MUC18-like n=1 Tax=Cyprinodon variegatus TaxID=28743 RepID=UPI0007428710|nr:PREDICTED: cell surface glycoprotein MUC18-like [Cyprinodon variegatus]
MAFYRGAFLFLLVCLLNHSVWGKVELTMNDNLEVYLGDSAEIPCHYSFYGLDEEPSFVMIQWFVGKRQKGRFREWETLQSPGTREKVQIIKALHKLLQVASCEARNGYPKPNITWYKDDEPLTPTAGQVNVITLVTRESTGFYSVQSTLEYKLAKQDKDSRFFCEVSFSVPGDIRVMESHRINVTVHYPTTMVELWKESPKGLVKEGDTVELRCQGDGNPPPLFIFSKEQEPDVVLESRGDVLMLPTVSRKDSGIYQCRPLDSVGQAVKGEVQLTVHYLDPAVVIPKDSEVMLTGEDLVASCNALSSLKTVTVWYKHWDEVMSKSNDHMTHSTVSVKVSSDVSAVCNASNDMGTEVKVFSIKAIPRVTRTAPFSPVEGSGVIIVVIILCLLLLAILGSVLYFLHKKGKIPCGRSGKQEITKEKHTKDDIVVEMKNNPKTEDAVLLKAVNGEKKGPNEQVTVV